MCKLSANFKIVLKEQKTMSTNIQISLDTRRAKKDGSFPLILRLSHNRKTIPISLGYSIKKDDWDIKNRKIKKSYTGVLNVTRLNNFLAKEKARALDIVTQLQDSNELNKLSVRQLKDRILNKSGNFTFFKFTKQIIDELHTSGRHSYASSMTDMLRAVKRVQNDIDLSFEQLNYKFLKDFETYYRNNGNGINSIGVYMRNIRAIYNRAIKEGHAKRNWYPFTDYSIKREKTRKRAVRKEVITDVMNLELPKSSRIWHAKNYFLFSFFAMGINFIDIAFLKPSNLVNGRLEYKRHKTNKSFSIKITEPMKEILNYYLTGKNPDDYIFPIIKRRGDSRLEYLDITSKRRVYNRMLREISQKCELETNLTSYVSRHSWATIAKRSGIPTAVISEGLGHSDTQITEVYLDSFDKEVLDDYNEMITG